MNVIYKPSTHRENYKGHVSFYPVVRFWGAAVSDNFFINTPQPTRSKALTIAKNHIKNIGK